MSVMYEPMVKGITNGRPTGQAGWAAFWRVGGDVVDPDAFRLLQLNSTVAYTALA
jgi:predicted phage gp36 major capsid-like protein